MVASFSTLFGVTGLMKIGKDEQTFIDVHIRLEQDKEKQGLQSLTLDSKCR